MEEDKAKHLVAGFLISYIGGVIFLPLAVLGFLAGFGKEWLDARGFGQVESEDIWFTCAGAGLGVIFLAVHYWPKSRS